jgi:hypothetical protein
VIKTAQATLNQLAPRFSEPPGTEAGLVLLHSRLSAAYLPWTTAMHHQSTVGTYTGGDYPVWTSALRSRPLLRSLHPVSLYGSMWAASRRPSAISSVIAHFPW